MKLGSPLKVDAYVTRAVLAQSVRSAESKLLGRLASSRILKVLIGLTLLALYLLLLNRSWNLGRELDAVGLGYPLLSLGLFGIGYASSLFFIVQLCTSTRAILTRSAALMPFPMSHRARRITAIVSVLSPAVTVLASGAFLVLAYASALDLKDPRVGAAFLAGVVNALLPATLVGGVLTWVQGRGRFWLSPWVTGALMIASAPIATWTIAQFVERSDVPALLQVVLPGSILERSIGFTTTELLVTLGLGATLTILIALIVSQVVIKADQRKPPLMASAYPDMNPRERISGLAAKPFNAYVSTLSARNVSPWLETMLYAGFALLLTLAAVRFGHTGRIDEARILFFSAGWASSLAAMGIFSSLDPYAEFRRFGVAKREWLGLALGIHTKLSALALTPAGAYAAVAGARGSWIGWENLLMGALLGGAVVSVVGYLLRRSMLTAPGRTAGSIVGVGAAFGAISLRLHAPKDMAALVVSIFLVLLAVVAVFIFEARRKNGNS